VRGILDACRFQGRRTAVWQETLTEAITLFVIVDPIGSASIFLALASNRTPEERRRVAWQSVVVAYGILIVFLIAGRLLLSAMGISITSFQIAGGVILLLFGLNMVFEFQAHKEPGPNEQGNIAVYPLAMPSLAGPGTIMTVVLLTDDDRYNWKGQARTAVVLLAIMLITYVLFRLAMVVHRFIGQTGASIVQRIMGLLLCAVAVDKILAGIADYYVLRAQETTAVTVNAFLGGVLLAS
jgi:multiple antibiotic resistance protein